MVIKLLGRIGLDREGKGREWKSWVGLVIKIGSIIKS